MQWFNRNDIISDKWILIRLYTSQNGHRVVTEHTTSFKVNLNPSPKTQKQSFILVWPIKMIPSRKHGPICSLGIYGLHLSQCFWTVGENWTTDRDMGVGGRANATLKVPNQCQTQSPLLWWNCALCTQSSGTPYTKRILKSNLGSMLQLSKTTMVHTK